MGKSGSIRRKRSHLSLNGSRPISFIGRNVKVGAAKRPDPEFIENGVLGTGQAEIIWIASQHYIYWLERRDSPKKREARAEWSCAKWTSCPKCPLLAVAGSGEGSGSEANSTKGQVCSCFVFCSRFNLHLSWMKKESEREEISAIGTEGRETVFVRFGRRKSRKQIGRALCKLIIFFLYKSYHHLEQ